MQQLPAFSRGFLQYLLLAALFFIPAPGHAQSFAHLTQPNPGRAMRASSADPDWDHGGQDWRSIGPGQSLTIAELTGPGVIHHIWMTYGTEAAEPWAGAPRDLALKFTWDDQTTASVNAPLGDFFAAGNGQNIPVESAMVQVGGNGIARAYNCYWPMPFARRARLVVENHHSTQTLHKLYYQVDWVKRDALPTGTLYFHARYNKARPLAKGSDYVVADITGPGQYVGTVFSLMNTPGVGFGEADDRFFIDGETTPSILGTGMEDYFGESWGFHDHNSLYHGYRGLSGGLTAYRWHVQDPIPFQKSLKLVFENWGGPPWDEYTWTEWSSVAFWYQQDALPSKVSPEKWGGIR